MVYHVTISCASDATCPYGCFRSRLERQRRDRRSADRSAAMNGVVGKPGMYWQPVKESSTIRQQGFHSLASAPLLVLLLLLPLLHTTPLVSAESVAITIPTTTTSETTPTSSSSGTSDGPDFYSRLVTLPSAVYGAVTKTALLPPERYDDALFNHSAFRDWLLRRMVLRQPAPGPAPMSYKCGVFVNHHYKIIFIRNRKAASTTVLDTFKAACKSQSKLLCMRPFDAEEMRAARVSHDQMWRSYFVVSSTRNPWARAASGFDYTFDRWPVKTGVCGTVNFRRFCSDPYLMGKMANLFRCGTQNSFRGDDAWAYDFYHVEPAHHCLAAGGGEGTAGPGLAVDFLIRYEHLQEDFSALLEILNARRDPSLPAIRAGKVRWMKQGVHVQAARDSLASGGGGGGSEKGGRGAAASVMWREDAAALVAADRHAVRYRECGMPCVQDIAAFFKDDIWLMQLQPPAAS